MAVSAKKANKSAGDNSLPWEIDKDDKDKDAEVSKDMDAGGKEADDDDDDEEEDSKAKDDSVSKADVEIRIGGNSSVDIATDDDLDDDDDEDEDDEAPGEDAEDYDDYQKSEADDDEEDDEVDMTKSRRAKARKSKAKPYSVSEESLEKALGALNRFVKSQDRDSRKAELLSKAAAGTLDEADRREMYVLTGGAAAPRRSLSRTIRRSFKESPEMKKSIHSAADGDADVTEFLQRQTDLVCKSLTAVAKSLEALSERQYNVNLALAKGIGQTGGGVLSICKRLQTIESQPAHEPRSISARPVSKSFAGERSDAVHSTEELVQTLTAMNQHSHASGMGGLTKSKRSISDSIASLLSSGSLPREMIPEIAEFRKSFRKGA